LNALYQNISNNTNSISIPIVNQQYTNYTGNLSATGDPNDAPNTAQQTLSNWGIWCDKTSSGSLVSSCPNPPQDQYFGNSTFCTYTYISGNSSTYGTSDCLVIPEWSSSTISSRYQSLKTNCPTATNALYSDAQTANVAYYSSMNSYYYSNSALLNKMIYDNTNQLNPQMSSTMNSLLTTINNVQGVVNPLTNLLFSLVGDNSIFAMINCFFIGLDINNIAYVFGGSFGTSSYQLGTLVGAISFLNGIMVIFTITMINFTIENSNKVMEGEANI